MFRISNLEFRDYLGFRILKLGFRSKLGFRISRLGFRSKLGFRILKLGFRGHLVFKILKLGFILTLLFIFMPTHIANAGIIGKPPTNLGLVGYWSMNEGTGSYAGDASGNKNTGTLTGGPTWVDGKRGKALNFDGVDDYVNAGSAASVTDLPAITVSAWIFPRIAGENNRGRIVCKATDCTSVLNNGWYFGIAGSNLGLQFAVDYSTNFNWPSVDNVISLGKWQHVAVTWNGNTSVANAQIYVNGVAVSRSGGSDGSDTRTSDSGKSLIIGECASSTCAFNGLIDEVRIYNRALSAAEIQALYKSGAATVGTINTANTSRITYNTASSAGSGTYGGTTSGVALSWSHTTGNGNNKILVVGVSINRANNETVSSVTYGKLPLTKLTSVATPPSAGSIDTELWYLKNPPSGIANIVVTPSAAVWGIAGTAATYFNVHQSSPFKTPSTQVNDANMINNVNPASKLGWLAIGVFGRRRNNSDNAVTLDSSQVSRATGDSLNSLGSGERNTAILSEKVATSSATFIWTWGVNTQNAGIGVSLQPAKITALNTSQNNQITNGLVGMWSFNGPDMSGATAYDRSGQGNNGTLTNGPTPAIGKVGQALKFDGVDDYVNVGDPASGNLDFGTGGFSVSVWVISRGYANIGSSMNTIIGKQQVTSTGWGIYINADNKARFNVLGAGLPNSAISNSAINNGQWHQIVGVRQDNGSVKIYVDGVYNADGTATTNSVSNALPLYIGNDNYSGSARVFSGFIDEVRVYNRALTEAEIKRLYNMGR